MGETVESLDDLSVVLGVQPETIIDAIVSQYLEEYPASTSASLSQADLASWTREELEELFFETKGDNAPSRDSFVYSGDIITTANATFLPFVNYIETKVFVFRALATFVWESLAGSPRRAQELTDLLERATLRIIRANMHHFADCILLPGSLTRLLKDEVRARPSNALTDREAGSPTKNTSPRTPSSREGQVLALASRGLSNGEIAASLGIAQNTVKNHLASLYGKAGVKNRTELARWAIENALV